MMKDLKKYILGALLSAVAFASCLDESLTSVTYGGSPSEESAALYMSVNVPRSYAGSTAGDKDTNIESIDVLVFAPGKADKTKFFLHTASKGVPTDEDKKFQVIMPVGKDFIVHVLANCHESVLAKGSYNSRGKEMNAMLSELTSGINVNDGAVHSLPMHGFLKGVDIDKTTVNGKLEITLLRSVAGVDVRTKASIAGDVITSGSLPDFQLRELYLYYYPDSGRVAADETHYEPLAAGSPDIVRNVTAPTLPNKFSTNGAAVSIKQASQADHIGILYLYENKPWPMDLPDANQPATTSRIVVGGIYKDDTDITYYRVDFSNNNNPTDVLRNHKYTFSIESVSGSGHGTPDDAAQGASINIYVKVFEWASEIVHADFDRQNYFYSETKSIVLPRGANSAKSIAVDSDVKVEEWGMSFQTARNGATTPVTVGADGKVTPTKGFSLANSRYKVEKSADGKSLTFTALKGYSDVNAGESRDETLILKANELNIEYRITQTSQSTDDWGDGGDLNAPL